VCNSADAGRQSPLEIAMVLREEGDQIVEGILQCSNSGCRREYPVMDGIPLIIGAIRRYVTDNILSVYARDDLTPEVESLLGDCCGADSPLDATRQQLSSYAWDHYADLDPDEPSGEPRPGAILRLLERGLAPPTSPVEGPVLDLGCSVGRSAFALAEHTGQLVLGVDMNFAMLRVAGRVLRTQRVDYPRRRAGVVYDRRVFPAHFENSENVDFWACDCQTLPLPEGSFGTAVGINLLDSVQAPVELIRSLAHVLCRGGQAILACPYDWSGAVTPIENWLGGHSQRGPARGDAAAVLRDLLASADFPDRRRRLEKVHEIDHLPWQVRLHDRSVVQYAVHLIVARVASGCC